MNKNKRVWKFEFKMIFMTQQWIYIIQSISTLLSNFKSQHWICKWIGITNWVSKILTKLDLDSLNTSEEEWHLVPILDNHPTQVLYHQFQKPYYKNRLSKVTNWSVQTLSLTFTPPPMHSRNPNQALQISYLFNL